MSSEFGEAAAGLAHAIAKSAIWFDGRCNWIGALPRDEPTGANAALGPDLYGGSSGVALFLAEAGARLDDDLLRATALGAIRHALDHAGGSTRTTGTGCISAPSESCTRRHGSRSCSPARSRSNAPAGCSPRGAERHANGVRGRDERLAGAVAGLLALNEPARRRMAGRSGGLAGRGGDRQGGARAGGVVLGSCPDGARCTTPAASPTAPPASGTLSPSCSPSPATLGSETRPERAFAYERSWFDSRSRTWPDLRDVGRRARRDAPMPTADSWCNGAPGIALSRLRAAALLGSAAVERDAAAAVAACERHVAGLLTHAPGDFSLCHGAAGAGDVLLYAADRRRERLARLAAEVGRRGIELHHGPGARGFPCGTPRGETPALMLGFAGIGMFYLRLLDPGVATPLLVRRRARVDSPVGASIQSQVPRPRRDQ